jgi:hypothetical protein
LAAFVSSYSVVICGVKGRFVGGMVASAGMLSWLLAIGGIGGMAAGAFADAGALQFGA